MGVGPTGLGRFIGGMLIGGVGIGVDEDDGQRLCAIRQQRQTGSADSFHVNSGANGAVRQGALRHLPAHLTRANRLEIAPKTPSVGAVTAAHFQRVAKARRCDDADFSALTL